MKVGIIQESHTANIDSNIAKLTSKIEELAKKGAQLIVLSELHNSLYFCQVEDVDNFDLAEAIPGKSTDHFSAVAKRLGVVIVISLFEKRATGLYHNTAVVLDKDGSIAGKYRKMHIPDDPAYYEKFYFTPGDLGFQPIQTSLGKLGLMVCWDQWYPEGARLMALAGADMLIYPTAIGWESTDTDDEKARQRGAWMTVQRGHAVANGLPGAKVTGPNGNSIFLPAVGVKKSGTGSVSLGEGYYWTRSFSPVDSDCAKSFVVFSDGSHVIHQNHTRYDGVVIRPVLNK